MRTYLRRNIIARRPVSDHSCQRARASALGWLTAFVVPVIAALTMLGGGYLAARDAGRMLAAVQAQQSQRATPSAGPRPVAVASAASAEPEATR